MVVCAGREGDEAVLEVTDNGPGMSRVGAGPAVSAVLPRPRGTRAAGPGAGAGHHQAAGGGARRHARASAASRGAAPPRRCASHAWTGLGPSAGARGAAPCPGSWPRRDEPPGILVVDDDPHARDLLRRLLGPLGQVSEAAVRAAPPRSSSDGPVPVDLVLTDMAMPDPDDGLRVLRAALAENPDTPVIVLTAFGNIEGALDTIQKGAFDYLTKPFDVDAIVRVVASGARAASGWWRRTRASERR